MATNRFIPRPIDLSNPAEEVYVILFGTGFRHRSNLANVSAKIESEETPVLFAGAQGDLVGVDQCNVRLPRSLAGRGEIGIALTVDGESVQRCKSMDQMKLRLIARSTGSFSTDRQSAWHTFRHNR